MILSFNRGRKYKNIDSDTLYDILDKIEEEMERLYQDLAESVADRSEKKKKRNRMKGYYCMDSVQDEVQSLRHLAMAIEQKGEKMTNMSLH